MLQDVTLVLQPAGKTGREALIIITGRPQLIRVHLIRLGYPSPSSAINDIGIKC